MAFEKNMFLTAKKVELNKSQFNVECNVQVNADCAKILTVQVDACVQNQEVMDGVITYAGVVDVRMVYMTPNGEICSVSSACPYSSKFEDESVKAGGCAVIKVDVIDVSNQIVGGDSIKVDVVLGQSGFAVSNQEYASLSCDDENVCVQTEVMEVVKFVGCGRDSLIVESDINCRDNIKKVLLTESKAIVKGVDAGANYVTISGDVISRVLYVNDNDKFESGYVHESFKQEVELAGATRDSFVEGFVSVCQEGVIAEIVQDEKSNKLIVKSPLNFIAMAYEKVEISVVKDLYSTVADVNITTDSFEMSNVCGLSLVEGKIDGTLILDDDKPRVDKVLFNGANKIMVTNSYIKSGEVFIEGIAQTTVVYLNDDTSSLYSVVIDVPFVVSDKVKCPDNSILHVSAVISDADVAVKKGREFIYDAKIKAAVSCCQSEKGAVISGADLTDELSDRNYAMEVVFAKAGQSLWEVAKGAHVKEEMLLLQNPDASFPVEKDTPIVLFYQRIQ